jgi:sugar (pentulose or hexulose) kinase
VKIDVFSIFWCFFMKPAVAERVSRAVTMVVGAGEPIGACDSKTARNNALFSCPVTAGGCDVLAVVVGVGGCETTLLGVSRLIWTCVTSSVCSAMLGAGIL